MLNVMSTTGETKDGTSMDGLGFTVLYKYNPASSVEWRCGADD
jgi:hypothetical protein